MYGYELPDHPDVRAAMRDGYPDAARIVFRCEECGEAICEGDEYYRLGGRVWCEDCVRDAKCEAES